MKPLALRLSGVATAALACGLVLVPAPSITSVRDASVEAPRPEEIEVLSGLADWVLGSAGELLDERDLSAVIRERPRAFELFRRYNDREAKRGFLGRLPYGSIISASAERYRLDGLLVAAVIEAESGFDPAALSPDGAVGLMQLMPATAAGVEEIDLVDPSVNIDLGTRYLSRLLRTFDGDLTLAVAAYNAGPAAVARYGNVPPFSETRRYVKRVLASYVAHHKSVWQASPAGETLFLNQ